MVNLRHQILRQSRPLVQGFSAACNQRSFLPSATVQRRLKQHKAFDADFDKNLLEEARKWKEKFTINHLPRGQTTYARSSGPGGQHVNKFVPLSVSERRRDHKVLDTENG